MPTLSTLFNAIQFRSLKEVQEVLEEKPELLNAANDIGETPLHVALHSDKIKVAEYLIQQGAEVNRADQANETLLATSVRSDKSIKLVQLLVDAGADVKAITRNKMPVIYWAAGNRNHKAVEILLKHGATLDLNSAVFLKPVEYFEEQLAKNPDALKEAPSPETLLDDAIGLSYVDEERPKSLALIKLFLEHGVDPNGIAPDRNHPIIGAMYHGGLALEFVKLLLEHGADPNVKNTHGTPIHQLIDKLFERRPEEKEELKKLLKQHGAKF